MGANFSLGVAVLADLVRRAAQMLPDQRAHRRIAPSTNRRALGTALLGPGRAEGGGPEPNYASLRAGDIVGEHLVQFTGTGERIELNHRATNRDIFARGAALRRRVAVVGWTLRGNRLLC